VPLTVFTSDRFADHVNPPGHPERVERAAVMQVVASEIRQQGGRVVEPRPATHDELARVHDREYLTLVRETAGRATALDPDTYTSPDTYEVACLAAGAGIAAVDHVLDGPAGTRALAMVRPPGHHAERNRAMGFCLFNNIAVAAAHARARGIARVAIVDYDVHHGNGTQWSFYDDPSVLFVSSHQFPFYPGTGEASAIGAGKGQGFTVNLPVEAGGTDTDFEVLYTKIAAPVLRQFRPGLILLSAGFDAHADDPLGGMRVSTDQLGRLTALIASLADECCDGRVVALTEGGYDLKALAGCLRAAARALSGEATVSDFPAPRGPAPRADATIAAIRPYVGKYWTI
jgi:acetoin utilization deacetylase AcuC-like enzyme